MVKVFCDHEISNLFLIYIIHEIYMLLTVFYDSPNMLYQFKSDFKEIRTFQNNNWPWTTDNIWPLLKEMAFEICICIELKKTREIIWLERYVCLFFISVLSHISSILFSDRVFVYRPRTFCSFTKKGSIIGTFL